MEEYSSRKSSIDPKMNERVITTKILKEMEWENQLIQELQWSNKNQQ